jgi:HSP20 family protein
MTTRWYRPRFELSPLRRVATLREELDNLFSHVLQQPFGGQENTTGLMDGWVPALDLYDGKDHLTVKVELPGLKKEDIQISLQEGFLSISGERKVEVPKDATTSYRSERVLGRFQRTVNLPCQVDADKIKATYTDGILGITLPKAEEAKPKQIQVSVKD